jgi:hypothetical protein
MASGVKINIVKNYVSFVSQNYNMATVRIFGMFTWQL